MLLEFEQVDKTKVKSEFLKQYIGFKEQNPDAILLFQIGDFFEIFFQDAKIFSDITGVTLSSRSVKGIGEILQAGIPKGALDFYIKKLLSENLKICLCCQYQTPDGKFSRNITRTYTPGTIIENEFLDSAENNYILALFSGENKYFLSYADVSTGQFYKTSGSFEQIVIEADKITPNELLIPENQQEIFKKITAKYNTTILKEEYFTTEKPEDAILKYCDYTQKAYVSKLDKIIPYKPESYLSMDEVTRRCLELTRTRRFLKKKGSLIWFLNYTKTPMGARLLKKYLDEPLLNPEDIILRQKAVEELIKKQNQLNDFENFLEQFCDLSRICAKISNSTIYPKNLFRIVKNAKTIELLSEICKKFDSKLLKINQKQMNETLKLAGQIQSALSEDSSDELRCGGIINDGYDTTLDFLRSKLKSVEKKIQSYSLREKKRLNIEKLKVDYSRTIGYYIEVPSSKQNLLPKEYLRKQALYACARYTTEQLQKFEEEICNLRFKINELEYELYCEIRRKAAAFVETIRNLANEIARIDVLVSFSRCAIANNLKKPCFNKNGIKIKEGFHPSLIKLNNEIVKNDTNLENGEMIILTGANMSGKSTYLKYNAIICLLSQIGSFIPADYADLSIADKIFIRQGSTDDIINNNSSFMVEMNDLKFILDNATDSSFILLDEPAKSTNTTESGAITRAFCDYLLKHFEAKIMLATHNIDITKLEAQYPNRVVNYVIGNTDYSENLISNRKIRRGVINSSLAINTAILANLPSEIIDNARKYLAK